MYVNKTMLENTELNEQYSFATKKERKQINKRSITTFSIIMLISGLLYAQPRPKLIPYRKGKLWGYCDTNRTIKIPIVYDKAYPFFSGKALVNHNKQAYQINTQGEKLKEFPFSLGFYNGGALIMVHTTKYKYGVINLWGRVLLKPIYDEVDEIKPGIFEVVLNHKIGQIDTSGRIVKKFKPYKLELGVVEFFEGHNCVKPCRIGIATHTLALINYKGKYGYINKNLQLVIPLKYGPAYNFLGGVALAGFSTSKPKKQLSKNGVLASSATRLYLTYLDRYGNTYYEQAKDSSKTLQEKAIKIKDVKIKNNYDIPIETAKKYLHPKFKAESKVGAFYGFTLINDMLIRKLSDLNKLYPLENIPFPGYKGRLLNQPSYSVLAHDNGQYQPVILDVEGNVFGFTVSSSGVLSFHCNLAYIDYNGDITYKKKVSYIFRK